MKLAISLSLDLSLLSLTHTSSGGAAESLSRTDVVWVRWSTNTYRQRKNGSRIKGISVSYSLPLHRVQRPYIAPSKKQSPTLFPSYAPLSIDPSEQGILDASLLLLVFPSRSYCLHASIAFGRSQQAALVLWGSECRFIVTKMYPYDDFCFFFFLISLPDRPLSFFEISWKTGNLCATVL